MIKAEDLRIGDIVRINENDSIKNGLIGKVTDIDSLREYKEKKGAITLNTIEDDGWYWGIWCCDIEPIPLTPEILEKNGWNKITEGWYFMMISKYMYLSVEFGYENGIRVFLKRTTGLYRTDGTAEKCNDFLAPNKVKELDRTSQALLYVQSGLMYQYSFVLGDRMAIVRKEKPVLANFTFGTAVLFLKAGMAVRRAGWNGKGLFVVKQVPAHITADIVPNMQSLPQSAKDIIMARKEPHIDYTNQMLIINPDGRADSWVPSSSDVFAEDWELVTE